MADQRIGPDTRLRVVDAILSGTHGPEESHYQVLRAFRDDDVLARAETALEASSYRTHEFGDSVLIFSQQDCRAESKSAPRGNHLPGSVSDIQRATECAGLIPGLCATPAPRTTCHQLDPVAR